MRRKGNESKRICNTIRRPFHTFYGPSDDIPSVNESHCVSTERSENRPLGGAKLTSADNYKQQSLCMIM